ncbi:cobalamin biosynthesis protein CbiG [Duganella sp. BJB488]|uniref:cobalamin biosynthesis protein n=1 Tax=unclassified Duganella TaxID=2636909 RepID=UPI000E348E2E|nr:MULTISPECIES: cobalamin biosynthesis protein [unclassified Duganella]RFP24285.1 cobalamin biosynthesis protein CbiG [Duganella sp. BJB489]RFP26646.1 cobalamin biosynthesis protein CbiG [Duganella sp. BJB488]RFP34621.1 cobalamin biosynthesis protein CbiG [Duganella sp. BJB480]
MTRYAMGLGCDRGVALDTVRDAVRDALAAAGAQPAQVVAAASITLKKDEAALLALAQEHGWPLHFYEAHELAAVEVPHPSETVRHYTGTPSVSEAAALLAAGPDTPMTALVVEKHKHKGADGRNATVSIARIEP